MKSEGKKWREFFVPKKMHGKGYYASREVTNTNLAEGCAERSGFLHTIEIGAYEALQKELKEATDTMEEVHALNKALEAENAELRAENERQWDEITKKDIALQQLSLKNISIRDMVRKLGKQMDVAKRGLVAKGIGNAALDEAITEAQEFLKDSGGGE